MLNELKELPARLRMYDSYEYVRKLLQSYTKVCVLYQQTQTQSWVLLLGIVGILSYNLSKNRKER